MPPPYAAGAPLLKSVAANFSQKFGLKIHTFYGASECGGIAYDASDALDYEDGFVGRRMRVERKQCLRDTLDQRIDFVDTEIIALAAIVGEHARAEPDYACTDGSLGL